MELICRMPRAAFNLAQYGYPVSWCEQNVSHLAMPLVEAVLFVTLLLDGTPMHSKLLRSQRTGIWPEGSSSASSIRTCPVEVARGSLPMLLCRLQPVMSQETS